MEENRTKLLIPAETKIGAIKAVRNDVIDVYDVLYGGFATSDKYENNLFMVKEDIHEEVLRKFLESDEGKSYVIPAKSDIAKVFEKCQNKDFIMEYKQKKEEAKRLEKEEKERLEKEKIAKEKAEKERLEKERQEKERQDKERLEKERLDLERKQKENLEKERAKQEAIKQEEETKQSELAELLEERRIKKENILSENKMQITDYSELNKKIDEENTKKVVEQVSSEVKRLIHEELQIGLNNKAQAKESNVFDVESGEIKAELNKNIAKLEKYAGVIKVFSIILPILCLLGTVASYLFTSGTKLSMLLGGLIGAIALYIELAIQAAKLLNKAHIERNLEIMALLEKDELGIPIEQKEAKETKVIKEDKKKKNKKQEG